MSTTSRPSGGKRIVFTGGSGKAGRHVIPYLLAQGHKVLNLDLTPFPNEIAFPNGKESVFTLTTDLTDSGQVFNALTSHFDFGGYEEEKVPGPPDVVIHFAAYSCNLRVPDSELFQANTRSTYNVIEAACKLGVKKIIVASSETVYGVCFAQGDADFKTLPLEEDYDIAPQDTYALTKVIGEATSHTFSTRFKNDIYCLRIGNVIEPHEYALNFPAYLNAPMSRKRNAWSYIDARDLGQICHLAIGKDGLGYQVFNATNNTITLRDEDIGTSKAFLEKAMPKVGVRREMDEREAPLSNRKIREVLGFEDVHDWRKYLQ